MVAWFHSARGAVWLPAMAVAEEPGAGAGRGNKDKRGPVRRGRQGQRQDYGQVELAVRQRFRTADTDLEERL